MNITICAFVEEWDHYRDRWDECGTHHEAECRLLYPATEEAAICMVAELLAEGSEDGHGEWQITILLDGRNPDESQVDLNAEVRDRIKDGASLQGSVARERRKAERLEAERIAEERRLEKERKSADARAAKLLEQERALYETLKSKFGHA